MWAPQLRTSGILAIAVQADATTFFSSVIEVEGSVAQPTRKSRSLNLGSSSVPNVG